MAAIQDTRALREMRHAVGLMRREVDAAIESMSAIRARLSSMALGLDLAIRAEDERGARHATAEGGPR
jgi:hypothetical protein